MKFSYSYRLVTVISPILLWSSTVLAATCSDFTGMQWLCLHRAIVAIVTPAT